MSDESAVAETTQRSKSIFRRSLFLPAEHGSWSWLLVPFGVGVLVSGFWTSSTWLTLVGGLALFFMRQPATKWVRIHRGRGRRSDERIAAGWTVAFALVALACLAGLIVLGASELLWLIPPIAILLTLYLALAFSKPSNVRTLWMELAGAAGLALMAPASYIAGVGEIESVAALLWLLLAGQNVLGVLYVRVRIADTHERPTPRTAALLAHLLVLIVYSLLALAGILPWLSLLPFAGFLARSAWTARQPRPIHNIKRFGFTEIGVEIVGGMLFVLAF